MSHEATPDGGSTPRGGATSDSSPLQTEFEFTLPSGYVDGEGTLHREGTMRLATAADEILPLKDPRVRNNESYLTVILLSRVVTSLGTVDDVTTHVVENLFVSDLAYLQELYERVNSRGADVVDTTCPHCGESFEVTVEPGSGSVGHAQARSAQSADDSTGSETDSTSNAGPTSHDHDAPPEQSAEGVSGRGSSIRVGEPRRPGMAGDSGNPGANSDPESGPQP